MNFSEIHHLHLTFKRRLTSILGKDVFPEITVSPPTGDSDELSFIRLVSWGYVFVYETGRAPLSFLKKLPPLDSYTGTILPNLHALRTWASHNLEFEKKRDIKTVRIATSWLIEKCQTGSPSKPEHWKQCFDAMGSDLKKLLEDCLSACDCFDLHVDRAGLISSFEQSLDRNWSAYLFDNYAEKALERFGYEGLSAQEIRSSNLDAWRKIVSSSADDESIDRNLTIRVENDILKLMAESFPMTSTEASGIINRAEREIITAAMIYLRESSGDNMKNVGEVLKALRELNSK
ncbi:hypothetical protein [Serratia marcescens]|jgi:hypothetical protein|uniref:hypothetical protein n=1 Tax=Serratia marcescens TaxID=615 RepID=UPI0027E5306C|nr:hypothetical protein [Serratia marcescens]HEJ7171869.1 hypothetical protein [Serratia marcescens]